jgi:hypothetical protein
MLAVYYSSTGERYLSKLAIFGVQIRRRTSFIKSYYEDYGSGNNGKVPQIKKIKKLSIHLRLSYADTGTLTFRLKFFDLEIPFSFNFPKPYQEMTPASTISRYINSP